MAKSSVPISARGRVQFTPLKWLLEQAERGRQAQAEAVAARRAELEALAAAFAGAARKVEAAVPDLVRDGIAQSATAGDAPDELEPVELDGVKYAADVADKVRELAAECATLEAAIAALDRSIAGYQAAIAQRAPATYTLRVPDYKDKTEAVRELDELGAFQPSARDVMAALRDFVRDAGDEFGDAVDLLERWIEYDDNGEKKPDALVAAVLELEHAIGPRCRDYRRLIAARRYYNNTLFGIRCATLILDFDNVLGDDGEPVKYARENGRMSGRCLLAMGNDVALVGSYVQTELARVNGGQEKNSELRSPSPSDRIGSQAA